MGRRNTGGRQLLREHRWMLAGCCVIFAVLISAFAILFGNVKAITRNARQLSEAQLGSALNQTDRLFKNYRRLCSILGANKTVAEFASFSAGASDSALMITGYDLQKELNSLISIYGEDINNLVLYFPSVGSIITIARNLHGDETRLFWENCPELDPDALLQLPHGTWWNPHFIAESSRSWIAHSTQVAEGHTVFVLIEYDLDSFSRRLTGQFEEMLVLVGTSRQCFFSSGAMPAPDVWQRLTNTTGAVTECSADGEKRFVLSSASCLPNLYLSVMLPAKYNERIEIMFYLVVSAAAIIILTCLSVMALYLDKNVFAPLQQLSQKSNCAGGDISQTLRAVAADYASMESSQDQLLKERSLLVPLALGRLLVRIGQSEKNTSSCAEAASCLCMAGLAPEESYALFAVTCTEDLEGFFEVVQKEGSAEPQLNLFYYLLNNILTDLLFSGHPGAVAILPEGWYAVLVACGTEAQAQGIEAVCQRLPEIYAEVFSAALIVTNLYRGDGAEQLFPTANQLLRKTSFLQFWGAEPPEGQAATAEQLSFTSYCQLVRKLVNQLGSQNYENVPLMLDEILQQAASIGAEDIQITKKRIYAMTSILAIAIDEQLGDEREFVDSLRLEERLYSAQSIFEFRRELEDILLALIAHRETEAKLNAAAGQMEEVRRYLLAHYQETGFNVTSVAEHFNLSVSYLSRSFKEIHGVNLLDYIHRLRVDAAKKLLPGNSIKAVSQQVGFWDTQGLIRAFKKLEGIGPGEYKKMLEKRGGPPV